MLQHFVALGDRVFSRFGASLSGADTIKGGFGRDAALPDGHNQGDDLTQQEHSLDRPDGYKSLREFGRAFGREGFTAFGLGSAGASLPAAGWWLGLARLAGSRRRGCWAGLCLWLAGGVFAFALWPFLSRAA